MGRGEGAPSIWGNSMDEAGITGTQQRVHVYTHIGVFMKSLQGVSLNCENHPRSDYYPH